MDPAENSATTMTRRQFFGRSTTGIGTLALASLLNQNLITPTAQALPGTGGIVPGFHVRPRAKRIIFLFMSGGPSQFETFDPKPKLNELSGKPMPKSLTEDQRLAQLQGKELFCMGTKFKFAKHGNVQADVSDLLPYTAQVVDDLTIIRSMQTDAINHDPAVTFFQCGTSQPGRPTMGSWMSYGLGSANRDLPAFVVLVSNSHVGQNLHTRYWGSGFLPSIHQGVRFRSKGDPVLYVSNPDGINRQVRRRILDGIRQVNQMKFESIGDPEIATRIEQYEMAYRMQASVPELMDVSDEPDDVFDLYGPEAKTPGTMAANCLLARRLAERDVRFIQLYHRGWDQHNALPTDITRQCNQMDRPCAALIKDLKQRGMLDDTIVLWSGEFGRTPMAQSNTELDNYGRDHHMLAFSAWVAGGGFKAGTLYGATDEFGYQVIKDPVHVHDLHATMLHLMGIDHLKLTYRFQGRDHRLTDVHGNVIPGLIT